jgi:hypothetical protein
MKHTRCEEVAVQLIVRTYDDLGRPVREQVTQQFKVFRNAETQDFWAYVDQVVKTMQQPPVVEPPPAPKGKKR